MNKIKLTPEEISKFFSIATRMANSHDAGHIKTIRSDDLKMNMTAGEVERFYSNHDIMPCSLCIRSECTQEQPGCLLGILARLNREEWLDYVAKRIISGDGETE